MAYCIRLALSRRGEFSIMMLCISSCLPCSQAENRASAAMWEKSRYLYGYIFRTSFTLPSYSFNILWMAGPAPAQ